MTNSEGRYFDRDTPELRRPGGLILIAMSFPMIVAELSRMQSLPLAIAFVLVILSIIPLGLSVSLSKVHSSLFQASRPFRFVILFYALCLGLIFPLSRLYLIDYDHDWWGGAKIVAWLLAVSTFMTVPYFISTKMLLKAGWQTDDDRLLNPPPEGSRVGNALSLFLGLVLLIVIICVV